MTYIDYNQFRDIYNKKKKISLFFLIFSIICLLLSLILVCLKINYLNQKTLKILGILITFCFSFISFSLLFGLYIPLKNNVLHINNVLNGKKSKCIGKVIQINKEISLTKKGYAAEIILNDENGNFIVYFDKSYLDIPFNKNDYVSIIVSDSFIIAYEVKHEKN